MKQFDKQLKYSIRKVSVGAASVVIGAFYLAMGAGVVHAETNTTEGGVNHSSPSPKPATNQPNSLPGSNYQAEPAPNPTQPTSAEERSSGVAATSNETNTESTTQPQPEATGAPSNTDESNRPRSRGRRSLPEQPTPDSTPDKRFVEHKGTTVTANQPGIEMPKEGTPEAEDPHAHIRYNAPSEEATIEEMWKIIQNMPDDFQNNERSYLHNMNTLGDSLRFDSNGKLTKDPNGTEIQPGEVREIDDFGGWHAINENGEAGRFAIGKKNKDGLFTGWYYKTDENGNKVKVEGGMLSVGSMSGWDIWIHDQALDRRFNYMLMLAKGRNNGNRNDETKDGTSYTRPAEGVKDYSPNVKGFNGIEKRFTAFSTKYGSRLKLDFATGHITKSNNSAGNYHIVVKAIKKDKNDPSKEIEEVIYDQTIHQVDGVIENAELYKKGVDLDSLNISIHKKFKDEFMERRKKLPRGKWPTYKTPVVLELTKESLTKFLEKTSSKFGGRPVNAFYSEIRVPLGREKDKPAENPTRDKNLNNQSDRLYKLFHYLMPTAKKITYHPDTDQLEIETDATEYIKELKTKISKKEEALKTTEDETQKTKLNEEIQALKTKISTTNSYTYKQARVGEDIGNSRYPRASSTITDEEISKKILDAIKDRTTNQPDMNKFGVGGYFSTGDIPLDKDVIAYKVSVFSGDDTRVGVLTSGQLVSYNIPILADFSVIQDTVEPSKELTRRIIDKLVKEGKITEEDGKKKKEELEKITKTSEIREKFFGDVAVKYVDTSGNILELKNNKKVGEKATDGSYLVNPGRIVDSKYDVSSSKLKAFSDANGNYYKLRSTVNDGLGEGSAEPTGIVTRETKVVTYVYERTTPPSIGKGIVHFKKQNTDNTTVNLSGSGYPDIELSGYEGEDFSTDDVDTKLTELKNTGYEIVTNELNTKSLEIDSIVDEDGKDPSQVYDVIVREKVVPVTPSTPENGKPDDKPTPESNHITIWVDENGKPLKPEQPGTHKPGNVPGYRLITTVMKDGITVHKFEKIPTEVPSNPTPEKSDTPSPETPVSPDPEVPTYETGKREELPNTGTEANAGLASAGIMTLLAGLGLGFFKKKEDEK